jgi:hypothetical protein
MTGAGDGNTTVKLPAQALQGQRTSSAYRLALGDAGVQVAVILFLCVLW